MVYHTSQAIIFRIRTWTAKNITAPVFVVIPVLRKPRLLRHLILKFARVKRARVVIVFILRWYAAAFNFSILYIAQTVC